MTHPGIVLGVLRHHSGRKLSFERTIFQDMGPFRFGLSGKQCNASFGTKSSADCVALHSHAGTSGKTARFKLYP